MVVAVLVPLQVVTTVVDVAQDVEPDASAVASHETAVVVIGEAEHSVEVSSGSSGSCVVVGSDGLVVGFGSVGLGCVGSGSVGTGSVGRPGMPGIGIMIGKPLSSVVVVPGTVVGFPDVSTVVTIGIVVWLPDGSVVTTTGN